MNPGDAFLVLFVGWLLGMLTAWVIATASIKDAVAIHKRNESLRDEVR